MNIRLKKTIASAILSAMATITFILESLFPPLIIPGARMGLSNVFILFAVIFVGDLHAFAVLIVKCLLGSLFSGNVSSLMYSLPSGVIALTVEVILIRFSSLFSVVAASVVGSVINMICQNTVFCLVTRATAYFIYLPYLAIIGVASGLIVGFAVYLVCRFMPRKYNLRTRTEEQN